MTVKEEYFMPLSDFLITHRWPPKDQNRIQYYGLATPNGVKVSIMLEELGLPYDAHRVDIGEAADQMTPEFRSLNPNHKIPAIIDPDGPNGQPMGLWESAAILIYLGDKTGKLLPPEGAARYETLQWLMWQIGGVGPMFGQVGYFHAYKGKEIADPRPRQRYYDEARRLLGVLDRQLQNREWMTGTYSVADIATAPWVRGLSEFYKAGPEVGLDGFGNVNRWLEAFLARPAVKTGLEVCA